MDECSGKKTVESLARRISQVHVFRHAINYKKRPRSLNSNYFVLIVIEIASSGKINS